MTYSGQYVKRLEDHRLLTGQSTYVDDIKLPGMLHGKILRSPYAHARIQLKIAGMPAPAQSST